MQRARRRRAPAARVAGHPPPRRAGDTGGVSEPPSPSPTPPGDSPARRHPLGSLVARRPHLVRALVALLVLEGLVLAVVAGTRGNPVVAAAAVVASVLIAWWWLQVERALRGADVSGPPA